MFVGREQELKILEEQIHATTSSFIAVYGRRRIGKTETIRYFCTKNNLTYAEFTGKIDSSISSQIKSFIDALSRDLDSSIPNTKISNWQEAFILLRDTVEKQSKNTNKIVLFFDEVPWFDTRKSNFINELAHFYNTFVSKTNNIILIVCGSAASYMIDKFIHNKGPLHNRLTHIIPMHPFDIVTTKKMLNSQGCHYSLKSIIDLFMIFGGVAKYHSYFSNTRTPQMNVQEIIFGPMATMKQEYEDLFSSLFSKYQTHYKIMNLLSKKWSGYSKNEIAKQLGMSAPGILPPLDELENSGFIKPMQMFGHKNRDTAYRASDPFSFFYNKWMSGVSKTNLGQIDFPKLFNSQGYKIWSGFAFENICFMHIDAIKKAIGISGVPTKAHYWSYVPKDSNEQGAQIDILLEHTNSRNIDIIECKYYDGEFVITKNYRDELKRKIAVFNDKTKSRYDIRLIFISVDGIARNEYFNELACLDCKAEDIFY